MVMGNMARGEAGMFSQSKLYGELVSPVKADVDVHACAVIVAALCEAEVGRKQPGPLSFYRTKI